jgi:predicted O-linked N-acetylglucosamine transferase (SPINDLY family)
MWAGMLCVPKGGGKPDSGSCAVRKVEELWKGKHRPFRNNHLQIQRFTQLAGPYDILSECAVGMDTKDLMGLAQSAHQRGDFAQAETSYRAVLEQSPDEPRALHFLGTLFLQTGNFAGAEKVLAHAAALPSADHLTYQNLGVAFMQLHRFDEAISAFDRALAVNPVYAKVHLQRGRALASLGRFEEAIANYRHAMAIDPTDARVPYFLGGASAALGRSSEAIAAYDSAIAMQPDFIAAFGNRGSLLLQLGRNQEALDCFDRALLLNDQIAEIHLNRGVALSNLGRLEEADTSYSAALALDPNCAHAYLNRSIMYAQLKHHEEALDACRKAIALNPDLPYGQSRYLSMSLQLGDWRDFEETRRMIFQQVEKGQPVQPLDLLLLPSSLAQQKKAAEQQVAGKTYSASPPARPQSRRAGRLRLGYLSADFKDHPVAYLLTDTLDRHDRQNIEVFGLSIGADDGGAMRPRIRTACEHFHDMHQFSDQQIAEHIRTLDIDVLIDLGGHTSPACARLLSLRPAPVQVSWLGFAGTTGASHIDYLLADPVVAPAAHASFYSEKLVWLPDCYLPPSARPTGEAPISRAEAGLPPQGFVFCCFNNNFKILPEIFSSWMRILSAVDHSVLWLRSDSAVLEANLRREALARGVDPARVIFAPRVAAKTHFARLALADMFLDTLPYNAHTTAGDALWSGVPVLTVLGETFVSRVAASLLTAAGFADLIAPDLAGYEQRAISLARDPAQYKTLKARLGDIRERPIFDAGLFTRHLEAACRLMSERFWSGAAPASFAVPRLIS